MRFDLYGTIHKAQRFHLFSLSNEIATADFSNDGTVILLRSKLTGLIEHLRDHARNEESYIHPLFRKLNKTAETLEHDHLDLEMMLDGLERIAKESRWTEMYQAYHRFLAVYLVHLDEEEEGQRESLWPHYGDDELAAVFSRFKAERSPDAAKADLVFMLPALSVPELTRMFESLKTTAPAAVFEKACELAKDTLRVETWERLSCKIR